MGKRNRSRKKPSQTRRRIPATVQNTVEKINKEMENGNVIEQSIDNCLVRTVVMKDKVIYMVEGSQNDRERYITRLSKEYGPEGYGVKPKIKARLNDTVILERRCYRGEFKEQVDAQSN